MLSNFLSTCLWLCAIVGFLGFTTATPVGTDPATLDSFLSYTYTPIYFTEADVSAYASASSASTGSAASASSDPSSVPSPDADPSSTSEQPTSPNPKHAKRFWPFDGPAWEDFYVFRNKQPNAPQVGKFNCPLMLEACYQDMEQLPQRDERRKYANFECKAVLCVQTKRACGYVAGWMC